MRLPASLRSPLATTLLALATAACASASCASPKATAPVTHDGGSARGITGCAIGTTRCDGSVFQTCTDANADGVGAWSGLACGASQTCQPGGCVGLPAASLFVSPAGNDAWSGTLADPNGAATDGPLKTLARARDVVRQQRSAGTSGHISVVLRGGTYPITAPVAFGPADSGSAGAPVIYQAMPGETPVISGGRKITGFAVSGNLWTVTIPDVKSGAWNFSALWVGGQRRPRAGSPNQGYYTTAGTASPANQAFKFYPGDLKAWSNPNDVVVTVFHSWSTSLHRIQSVDTTANVVTFTGPARFDFEQWGPDQRYRVENVRELLDAPGEWYLDRSTGVLTYWPMPGEDPATAEVVAPVAPSLIAISGDPRIGKPVRGLTFRGLRFEHTEWTLPPEGMSSPQAAVALGGAIDVAGGLEISIEDCRIAHASTYGIWFRYGTTSSRVVRTELTDLGGGGVRFGDEDVPWSPAYVASANVLDDSFIHEVGWLLPGAVGVWIGRSSWNQVTHNEISDIDYTGVSVGWDWTFAPSSAHDNLIADNHIHHIGRGVLSDLGGIYTVGVSPGTELRRNVIHHVTYNRDGFYTRTGAWGIYNDQGSSQILMHDNVVYAAACGQDFGEGAGNVVRNNIFAFAPEAQLRRSLSSPPNAITFEKNVVLVGSGFMFGDSWSGGPITSDDNVFWDLARPTVLFDRQTLPAWQAAGLDTGSVIADPQFPDPLHFVFQAPAGSPEVAKGFTPIDTSGAGLYGDPSWVSLPASVSRPADPPISSRPPAWSDGFEATGVGRHPRGATTPGETPTATVRVSADTAATGSHSLKLIAGGAANNGDPYVWYLENFFDGRVRVRFNVRLGAGAVLQAEWRDAVLNPYLVGPRLVLRGGGLASSLGTNLMTLPTDTWIGVEVVSDVGCLSGAASSYSVTISVPGSTARTFTGLATTDRPCGLRWLGFLPLGDAGTVIYLDDLSVEPL
jgi:hypothetical protein